MHYGSGQGPVALADCMACDDARATLDLFKQSHDLWIRVGPAAPADSVARDGAQAIHYFLGGAHVLWIRAGRMQSHFDIYLQATQGVLHDCRHDEQPPLPQHCLSFQ